MGVDFLLDPKAAFFVAGFILAPLLLLGFESATDRAVLMRDLGIPAGLVGSVIGTQNMINSATGGTLAADWIYGWTGLLFLTTLYGGVFSALGFFLSGSGRPEAKTIQNRGRLWRGKLICLLALGPWVGNAIYHGGGLEAFFQPIPACIFLTVVVIAILTGRKGHYLSNLSQGCLISSLTISLGRSPNLVQR